MKFQLGDLVTFTVPGTDQRVIGLVIPPADHRGRIEYINEAGALEYCRPTMEQTYIAFLYAISAERLARSEEGKVSHQLLLYRGQALNQRYQNTQRHTPRRQSRPTRAYFRRT